MREPVTREALLSGENRFRARCLFRDLVLPMGISVEDADAIIDSIAAIVIEQVEEDRKSRYGGQNEGV